MPVLGTVPLGLVLRIGDWDVRRFIHPTGTTWRKGGGGVVSRRKSEVLVAEVGGWVLGRQEPEASLSCWKCWVAIEHVSVGGFSEP